MLIGLTGKAGAGKDSVADILCQDYGFKRTAFALHLKTMLASIDWPEPTRQEKEAIDPRFGVSWRQAAQRLGTEWARALDPDLWVKLTKQVISTPGDWVITDVRFENEAKMVRENGVLIHVKGREADLKGATKLHISEQGVPERPEDMFIDNSGTLEVLNTLVEALNEDLGRPRVALSRLKELLNYDYDTGIFTNKVTRSSGQSNEGVPAGFFEKSTGYTRLGIDTYQYAAHKLAWFMSYSEWPSEDIDHINGIKTDNRLVNLRLASRSENMQNKSAAQKNSKTGVRGVSFYGGKYRAEITVNGISKKLGGWSTLAEAEAAYLTAKTLLHPFSLRG